MDDGAELKADARRLGQAQHLSFRESQAVDAPLLIGDERIERRSGQVSDVGFHVKQSKQLRRVQPVAVVPVGLDRRVQLKRVGVDFSA
ncbi:MAG: hypothetical protein V8T51_00475 [Senegalimassilia faecalis]